MEILEFPDIGVFSKFWELGGDEKCDVPPSLQKTVNIIAPVGFKTNPPVWYKDGTFYAGSQNPMLDNQIVYVRVSEQWKNYFSQRQFEVKFAFSPAINDNSGIEAEEEQQKAEAVINNSPPYFLFDFPILQMKEG